MSRVGKVILMMAIVLSVTFSLSAVTTKTELGLAMPVRGVVKHTTTGSVEDNVLFELYSFWGPELSFAVDMSGFQIDTRLGFDITTNTEKVFSPGSDVDKPEDLMPNIGLFDHIGGHASIALRYQGDIHAFGAGAGVAYWNFGVTDGDTFLMPSFFGDYSLRLRFTDHFYWKIQVEFGGTPFIWEMANGGAPEKLSAWGMSLNSKMAMGLSF